MSEWYKSSDGYYVNDNYSNIFIEREEYGEYRSYNSGWFVYSEINGRMYTVGFKKQKDGYYKAILGGPKVRFTSFKQVTEVIENSDLSDIYTTRYIRTKQIWHILYELCDGLPGCASRLASYFNNDEVVLELDDENALEDYVVDTLIDKYQKGEIKDKYINGTNKGIGRDNVREIAHILKEAA